jgi:hypothetical protein
MRRRDRFPSPVPLADLGGSLQIGRQRRGSSGELSMHARFVAATVVQHAPRNAGELVGQCRSDDVVMHALGGSLQPPAEAVLGPIGRAQQHDPSRLHEQHAKIAVPTLGDAAGDGAIAGRDLSWFTPVYRDRGLQPGAQWPPQR